MYQIHTFQKSLPNALHLVLFRSLRIHLLCKTHQYLPDSLETTFEMYILASGRFGFTIFFDFGKLLLCTQDQFIEFNYASHNVRFQARSKNDKFEIQSKLPLNMLLLATWRSGISFFVVGIIIYIYGEIVYRIQLCQPLIFDC